MALLVQGPSTPLGGIDGDAQLEPMWTTAEEKFQELGKLLTDSTSEAEAAPKQRLEIYQQRQGLDMLLRTMTINQVRTCSVSAENTMSSIVEASTERNSCPSVIQ